MSEAESREAEAAGRDVEGGGREARAQGRETDAAGERGDAVVRMRLVVLMALGGGAVVLLTLLLFPFLPALVTSAVLATLCYPAHRRLLQMVRQPDVAAFLTTTAVFFLVLLPTVGLSLVLIDQVRQGVEWLGNVVESLMAPGGLVTRGVDYLQGYLGVEAEEITGRVTEEMSGLVGLLARRTFSFLSGLGGWLLQAAAALFTLFYFLRDAEGLMGTVKWLIPLDPKTTDGLVEKTRDVIFATVLGNVAVAVVQGTLGGFAFWILGLPASALWGTVMGVLSLLPVVGPALVWIPAVLILLGEGEILRGLVLLVIGGGVISTVDNYLRAVLIGGRAHLHSLLVFFSVLAGLFAFGAVGIFVGPVLFVIALSLLEIARAALDPPRGGSAPAAAGGAGAREFSIFRASRRGAVRSSWTPESEEPATASPSDAEVSRRAGGPRHGEREGRSAGSEGPPEGKGSSGMEPKST